MASLLFRPKVKKSAQVHAEPTGDETVSPTHSLSALAERAASISMASHTREPVTDGTYRPARRGSRTMNAAPNAWSQTKLAFQFTFQLCHLPLLAFLTLGVLLVAILPTYYSFKNERNDLTQSVAIDPVELASGELDAIVLVVRTKTFDPASYTATLDVAFYPQGSVAQDVSYGYLGVPLGYQATLVLGGSSIILKPGDSLSHIETQEMMLEFRPRIDYPFDSYFLVMVYAGYLNVDYTASYWDSNAIPANYTPGALPLGIVFVSSIQGFRSVAKVSRTSSINVWGALDPYGQGVDYTKLPIMNGSGSLGAHMTSPAFVQLNIDRSSSTKFFSMFIVMLMWMLSLSVFAISIDNIFIRKATITYESPSLALGLLFTLPFVRQVQPGAPDMGCTIDIVGFFWNMGLIALTTILLLCVLGWQSRSESIARKLEEEEEEELVKQMQRNGQQAARPLSQVT